MASIWTIEQIENALPQRRPFIFIDGVDAIDIENARVVCYKNVTMNENFLQGHFPNNPVMPGVLITEALAQAGIILYAVLKPEVAAKKPIYYLGKSEIRFTNPVLVGDKLMLDVTAEKLMPSAGIVSVKALVDNKTAAHGKIYFGIKN
ncbi:MAG: 3-hydroxyacyl-ACP dehydratase FabZ [Candidatus Omnitrophica bacterium]|nr:3-hydroxyacyl-ACP dehydratase FabZ [Candidatus Omnitrophota bacterium]MDD5081331.1 3-hydroxyacyl-ACP dehydratase FabZ [Candidatus Omnitrophota bacterium]MDD5440983.1 3-hydroxyacyl-ACP dehydratase FabZ [Candidatus Omnitrophota bacterium]